MNLSVVALGSLQVRLDSTPVTKFRFERVRALLAYLLVEGDMIHDRASIAFLLWPDLAQKAALQNLRQAVAMLRRALQDRQRDVPFIEATSKTIQFNPHSEYVFDFAKFTEKINHVKLHAHRSLESCSTCIEALRQATDLYRGEFLSDIFIESEQFEEWSQAVRSRLHFQAVWGLRKVLTYYARRQDYMLVIELAQKLLRIDPLCEVGHHMLITAFAAQGHRHAAINHYSSYRTLLQNELGIEPPRKTIELHEQLITDRWRVQLVNLVPFHNLPTTIHPTIGRVEERKHIANLLARKDCRLLTLTGIGGSGKTQLALEAAWEEVPNFHNGTYFVNLTDVTSDQLIAKVIRSLPIEVHSTANLKFQLLSWLREKEVLIVLDNFGCFDESQLISTLLQVAPLLSIIITAPTRLLIRGEHVVMVRGLPLPENESMAGMEASKAVQLFLQYTRPLKPHFSLTSYKDRSALFSLCRMVGGLPIAIELIAYLSLSYSLAEIAARVVYEPEFLTCVNYKLPGRHCNMASIFDGAWQQLTDEEQQAFLRLCEFDASFSLHEATHGAQIAAEPFFSLETKSLIQTTCCSIRPNLRPFPPLTNNEIQYEIIPIFRQYRPLFGGIQYPIENVPNHLNYIQ